MTLEEIALRMPLSHSVPNVRVGVHDPAAGLPVLPTAEDDEPVVCLYLGPPRRSYRRAGTAPVIAYVFPPAQDPPDGWAWPYDVGWFIGAGGRAAYVKHRIGAGEWRAWLRRLLDVGFSGDAVRYLRWDEVPSRDAMPPEVAEFLQPSTPQRWTPEVRSPRPQAITRSTTDRAFMLLPLAPVGTDIADNVATALAGYRSYLQSQGIPVEMALPIPGKTADRSLHDTCAHWMADRLGVAR